MSGPIAAVRGLALTLPWAAFLLVADLGLSLLLPVSAVAPKLAYNVASQLAYPVWAWIQGIFERANGAQVRLASDSSAVPQGESAIVVANHVAWSDFYLVQAVAARAGMLSRCRWFAKAQLKQVPLLGWGLWAMGMPLVTRDWTHDRAEMERVFGGIRDRRLPIWLVAYSEATRYTPDKHAAAVRWCEDNGRKPPRHTLWPRYRGFVACVNQLRAAPHVRAVYDVTIAYAAKATDGRWRFMRAPSMWGTLSRAGLHDAFRFYVHVDRTPLEDLPDSDDALRAWLENAWQRKDDRLEKLKVGLEEGKWDGEDVD